MQYDETVEQVYDDEQHRSVNMMYCVRFIPIRFLWYLYFQLSYDVYCVTEV